LDLVEGNRFNYVEAEEGMQRLVEVLFRDRHELGIQIDEPTDHIQATARFVLLCRHRLRTQQGTHFVIYPTHILNVCPFVRTRIQIIHVPETSTLDGVSGDDIQRSRDNIKGIWGTYPPKVTTRADGR
jgi:hypothetical protein